MAKPDLTRRQFLKALPVVAGLPFILSNSGRVDAARLSSPDIRRKPIPEPGQIIAYHDSLTPSHVYFAVVESHNEFGDNPSNGIVERFGGSNNFLRVTLSEGSTAMGGVTSYVDLESTQLIEKFGSDLSLKKLNEIVKKSYVFDPEFTERQRYQAQALLAGEVVTIYQAGLLLDEIKPEESVKVNLIEGTRFDIKASKTHIDIDKPHSIVAADLLRKLAYKVGSQGLKIGLVEAVSFKIAGRGNEEGIGFIALKPNRVGCLPSGSADEKLAKVLGARDSMLELDRGDLPDFINRLLVMSIRFQEIYQRDIDTEQIETWIASWYPENVEQAESSYRRVVSFHC